MQVCRDHLLDGDERLALAHLEEPREQRRDLHTREARGGRARIAHHDGQVQRQVGDVGERMRRIHRQRREDRKDLIVEDLGQGVPVGLGQVVPAADRHVLPAERRHQLVQEQIGHPVIERLDPFADLLDGLGRRQSVLGTHLDPGRDLLLQSGDAHLEELVQVLTEDGQELQTVQQQGRRVLGDGEDPGVEVEPGELAVEERRLGRERPQEVHRLLWFGNRRNDRSGREMDGGEVAGRAGHVRWSSVGTGSAFAFATSVHAGGPGRKGDVRTTRRRSGSRGPAR